MTPRGNPNPKAGTPQPGVNAADAGPRVWTPLEALVQEAAACLLAALFAHSKQACEKVRPCCIH